MVTIATLVGCAIGDALGNPFEMKLANYQPLVEWDGLFREGGTFWWGQPGQYTDDTLMSMALTASLLEHQGYNPDDAAQKYLAWMESGNTRGIGGTTAAALTRVKLGAHHTESGLILNADGTPVGGNGTAMRAGPIGLAYRKDLKKLLEVAMLDASITHNSMEPKLGSIAVALGTAILANRESTNGPDNMSLLDVIYDVGGILPQDSVLRGKFELLAGCLEQEMDPMEALASIGSNGYVPETVAAAFYCLGATDNFKDCVVLAVRAGGDTDTTAAVAGALAGTWYGIEGIPEEYDSVENRELLQGLTDELLDIEIE
jgi:ADP-ribosyl-[dinitrogen reductase] hydrolase